MDVIDAWHGYARSKGIKLEGDVEYPTREELDELMNRFPDKPHD